ncbi:MAG: class I SAM-dependent methyltransferase [Pseudomonadales bacterium]
MTKRLLKKLFSLLAQPYRKHRARKLAKRLTSHESEKIKAIGYALEDTLNRHFTAEEQTLIEAVEQRRSKLLNSEEEIAVIDYGAGRPNSNRNNEEMEQGILSTAPVAKLCKASKSKFWAIFLFKLIRRLTPLSCVELGSCVGISASYQASALKLNGAGWLTTLEGSPKIAKIARESLQCLNLENVSVITGPFHETFKGVLESSIPVDFFFNDGHHDHDAVLRYFREALPYLTKDSVIVFDDISWSSGMRKAWLTIENDDRVATTIDLGNIGIAVMGKSLSIKNKFRAAL